MVVNEIEITIRNYDGSFTIKKIVKLVALKKRKNKRSFFNMVEFFIRSLKQKGDPWSPLKIISN